MTKKGNRRRLSFANSIIANPNGKNATLDDWIQVNKQLEKINEDADFDHVPSFGKEESPSAFDFKSAILSVETEKKLFYDAILFATDSDFLESAKTVGFRH